MYYYLRSRKNGRVKAISKHQALKDFARGEWACEKSEEWPLKDAKTNGPASPSSSPSSSSSPSPEPTVRPKFKTSTCAYLMYC